MTQPKNNPPSKHHWTTSEVAALYHQNFNDLIFAAQTIHRENFDPNEIQISTLLSIKTGACPEDCSYCPQSGHYNTGLSKEKLMPLETIMTHAKCAKENGADRFCMGAAWRNLPEKELPKIKEIIQSVKSLGLETCVTLGMLEEHQAQALKEAGLDYYNHNLDSSPEFYQTIITTRTYEERLDTLAHVRNAGIKTCCGGIIGMGETQKDRIELLAQLANLPETPQSVPINRLVPIPGTPLENIEPMDNFEFIRTIAVARMMMPKARIRLSAGRDSMSDEMQALCFLAGANSIFSGDKLLVTKNADQNNDEALFKKLGLNALS